MTMSMALGAALPASIPSPSSGEISIGPLSLRAYGLLIALGVIAAIWLFGKMLERRGTGTAEDASSVGISPTAADQSGSSSATTGRC